MCRQKWSLLLAWDSVLCEWTPPDTTALDSSVPVGSSDTEGPHLHMDDPVPLRVFGYPAPEELLAMDASPFGWWPDGKRTNLLESPDVIGVNGESEAMRHDTERVDLSRGEGAIS